MVAKINPEYEATFVALALTASADGSCAIEGCSRKAGTRNVCSMHYKRIVYQGRVERKNRGGGIRSHPLYSIWAASRQRGVVSEVWEDFNSFVRDVGARPTFEHELHRLDSSKLYGPSNFVWKVPTNLTSNVKDGKIIKFPLDSKEYAEARKDRGLKKRYGISLRQYWGILTVQGGGCAICGEKEAFPASLGKRDKVGRQFSLAVDHNHRTGRVRGILCHNCNQALGLMRDNPDIMRAAASYLAMDLYAEQQKKG